MKYVSLIVVAALLAFTSVGSVEAGKGDLPNTQTIKRLKARGVEAVYVHDVDAFEGRLELMSKVPVPMQQFIERIRLGAPDMVGVPVDFIEVAIVDRNLDEHINLFIDHGIEVHHVRENGNLLLRVNGMPMVDAGRHIGRIDPACLWVGVYLTGMDSNVIRYGERPFAVIR